MTTTILSFTRPKLRERRYSITDEKSRLSVGTLGQAMSGQSANGALYDLIVAITQPNLYSSELTITVASELLTSCYSTLESQPKRSKTPERVGLVTIGDQIYRFTKDRGGFRWASSDARDVTLISYRKASKLIGEAGKITLANVAGLSAEGLSALVLLGLHLSLQRWRAETDTDVPLGGMSN